MISFSGRGTMPAGCGLTGLRFVKRRNGVSVCSDDSPRHSVGSHVCGAAAGSFFFGSPAADTPDPAHTGQHLPASGCHLLGRAI
jgi:hypothetical protein